MSPMMPWVVTISAPPPRPWMARNAISSVIPFAAPHSTEPIRNTTSATCSTILRPYWSPSLPAIGVVMVDPSR